jgi:hypothetical protein
MRQDSFKDDVLDQLTGLTVTARAHGYFCAGLLP